jgi:hypothetical protein
VFARILQRSNLDFCNFSVDAAGISGALQLSTTVAFSKFGSRRTAWLLCTPGSCASVMFRYVCTPGFLVLANGNMKLCDANAAVSWNLSNQQKAKNCVRARKL